MTDYKTLIAQTIETAKEAGAYLKNEQKKLKRTDAQIKGQNELVSYVDKTSEDLIIQRLTDAFPDAGVYAEEGARKETDKEYTWMIDPLDGTTNYVHGLPVFAVSIGLLKDGKPVLGVVYGPVTEELFWAYEGGGAFLNGEKIQISGCMELRDALLSTGFPYRDYSRINEYFKAFRALSTSCMGIRRWGCAALDLCYLAAGRYDGFFEYALSPYDVAAGAVIIQEAGGKVSDFKGRDNFIFGKEFLAGGHIFAELSEIIKKHWGYPRPYDY